MTTPANPTPEPDGAKKSAPTTEYMVRWIRDDAEFERGEKLHGIAKFYGQIADRLESQQTDLADTRRRLAEVEKERDDARAAIKQAIELLEKTNAERKVYKRGFHSAADNLERKLTALRNAADGMAGIVQSLTDIRHAPWSIAQMQETAKQALAAYAALTEGAGKETSL